MPALEYRVSKLSGRCPAAVLDIDNDRLARVEKLAQGPAVALRQPAPDRSGRHERAFAKSCQLERGDPRAAAWTLLPDLSRLAASTMVRVCRPRHAFSALIPTATV